MHTARSIYLKLKGRSVRDVLRDGPEYVRAQLLWAARTRYYRWTLHGTAARTRERRRAALEKLDGGGTVLFGCHGNICRSPFAERYARDQLDARGVDDLDVESVGFIDNSRPESPPKARAAARRRGVNLAGHRSRQADAQRLERADLVLLADYRNYHRYATRFPEAADRLFLLGVFGDNSRIAVSDPYGGSSADFENAYDRLAASIDAFLDAYAARSGARSRAVGSE